MGQHAYEALDPACGPLGGLVCKWCGQPETECKKMYGRAQGVEQVARDLAEAAGNDVDYIVGGRMVVLVSYRVRAKSVAEAKAKFMGADLMAMDWDHYEGVPCEVYDAQGQVIGGA